MRSAATKSTRILATCLSHVQPTYILYQTRLTSENVGAAEHQERPTFLARALSKRGYVTDTQRSLKFLQGYLTYMNMGWHSLYISTPLRS